jgi:hypothetical protein
MKNKLIYHHEIMLSDDEKKNTKGTNMYLFKDDKNIR